MRIGDFDIEISAQTSLEMLVVLGYYCAYDGNDADAEKLRSLLQTKIGQCNDETLNPSVPNVDFVDYLSNFDSYTVQEQIALLAKLAYKSEMFFNNKHYDDIKKIYNLIILNIFDHEPESVHPDGDEVNFEVEYGNLIVELSDIDLLNLILVDRYLFMNVPLGLGPDTTLNLTAELERRSDSGDKNAEAILAWSELYFYRER
jgi:hypothetical protein